MEQIALNGYILGQILPYTQHLVETEDTLTEIRAGVYRWTRIFQSAEDHLPLPVSNLRMDLALDFQARYRMIPGVSYDGNEWGDGKEPQGFTHGGTPYTFAHHRTAVAGCTYAQDDCWGIGMYADMNGLELCGLACSIAEEEGKTILSLLFPEQEMPVTYVDKGKLIPGYSHTITISREKPLICTAYICAVRLEEGKAGYASLLDLAWEQNVHVVRPWYDVDRIWELSLRFAKESLWLKDSGLHCFSIGLQKSEKGFAQVRGERYEAGWCGQNISYGISLLHDYLLRGNEDSLEKGFACLDTWMKSRLENGLAFVHLDALLLDEADRVNSPIDSCNLGVMAENYLEAFEAAAKCGKPRPGYQEIALGICNFVLDCQYADGRYPAAFNCLGEIIQPDGSTGGFLVPAMLRAYALTKSEAYLDSAKRAFASYMTALEKDGYSTAGALDTYCIDKESAMPLLSSALMLYTVTSEGEYLRKAEYIAYYLSTWQWHHTVTYPRDSLLHMYNYDTFGGTGVSTQHHHQDPYALRCVPDLFRLAELTGRGIWKERAMAAWNNATIGISDGTLAACGRLRPAGSQDEGFYHTRWSRPFSASQWLVAWPAAFRLETLRKTDFLRRAPLNNMHI